MAVVLICGQQGSRSFPAPFAQKQCASADDFNVHENLKRERNTGEMGTTARGRMMYICVTPATDVRCPNVGATIVMKA